MIIPRSVLGDDKTPSANDKINVGLIGIGEHADAQRPLADAPDETSFLDSVVVAVEAVMRFAERLAAECSRAAGRAIASNLPRRGPSAGSRCSSRSRGAWS